MIEYCQHCPRRYDATCPGKPGACTSDGEANAKLLLVGESPREHELGSVPFVGPAGECLWRAARASGFSKADCRIMNVCNCWPIGDKGKNLSENQIGSCWERFADELSTSSPTVIVCLGGDALRRITGLSQIDRYRGYLFSTDQLRSQTISLPLITQYKTSRKCVCCKGSGGIPSNPCPLCSGNGYQYRKGDPRLIREKTELNAAIPASVKWIIATYHPSYVMRMGKKPMRAFLNDLNRAVRASNDELQLTSRPFVTRAIEIPAGDDLIAFDIENAGGLEGSIERMGMASESCVWTAPWNHETRERSREALADSSRIKVAHNLQHDLKHLEADGITVPGRVYCSMWSGMTLEPDLPMGLRSMAPLWLDLHGCWKDESDKQPEYYNAMDAIVEYELAKAQIARHKQLGSYNSLMKFVMPALRVLLDMNRTGMHVDLEWLGGFSQRLHSRELRVRKVWEGEVDGCDIGSPLQVQKYLYGRLGMEVVKDPDNGWRPTTAAWALQKLKRQYPEYRGMLRALLAFRWIEKLQDCCNIALGADGAVHPQFGPHWKDEQSEGSKRKGTTSTLRLSVSAASGMNMQQITKFARRMYVPPPGFVFVDADLDRAEPWVYAARSGDKALIQELTHGDPYLRVAQDANCDRQTAKILFLARTYGAQAKKGGMILMKQGLDSNPALVNRVFGAMARQYPTLERYRETIGQQALKTGRLQSGFGFVRNFLGGGADVPEAQDWEAQHHVAVTLLSLLPPLQALAKSLGGWLAITVYDSATLCVPADKAIEAGKGMLEIMRTERPEIARGFKPACSEIKIGTNWRDLHAVS